MEMNDLIADIDDLILITGANGFIGCSVVETLLEYGFKNIRCFVRPSSDLKRLNRIIKTYDNSKISIINGNLLSPDDCLNATKDVKIVFHLAAGVEKSFAGCILNSVVTTRNLLDSILKEKVFKRFLNVSSFAVYSGLKKKKGEVVDEDSEVEANSHLRYEGYTYGKIKQDELVFEYHKKHKIPLTIVRPGVVYGPGKANIFGRVGIDTFGIFLHLGGQNIFPITYVKNCADAIVLAGIKKSGEGEIFNIVDDNLPTCSEYLDMYKKNVKNFRSIYIPYQFFYFLSYIWEKYSKWSDGQLPPAFNRMRSEAHWKGQTYTNKKLKDFLGWKQRISTENAINIYFEYLKSGNK